ncbi:putative Drebrin-like protein [Triangularia setosa]|uniref:Drebrin-like protein n=1 Tax=Triangularia setosa TaxID=2587417 RepID=A0AAN7AAT9_9PEZI|nr:putative Drebrin-like protein [Podospora setosa]
MSSLNLSTNGVAIKNSYQGVINGTLSSTSPTAARWALFTVQAPLLNAFQNTGSKESVLKVETTGDGELADLVEDFNEGRIQFAFVRVKDPNSGLPKNVFIAWCGGGVPERTKGYFTSHVAAVTKVLTGYHVQITARSDADLEPEAIMQKVADASGAKYSAGSAPPPAAAAAPPPVAKKPVFTPTTSSPGTSFNPLVAARNRRQDDADDDGWGADAPPVSRTQIEKVAPAYKPTKVDIAGLRKNPDESRHSTPSQSDDQARDVVKGGYQPVGRVDLAALRAQAKQDDRPAVVKGAYEPVGKVDIAAIRAKSQRPVEPSEEPSAPKSLAERTAAFTQSERLTELPKPKVAKKFGNTPFTGTKAPTPTGYGAASAPAPPPVGAASRTFADQGGKTPAQLWAEKKAKQGGSISSTSPGPAPEITAQKSGSEWKSGYAGKSWAPVSTTNFGRGGVEKHATGGSGTERSQPEAEPEPAAPSPGGISALRDRFKDQPPIGTSSRSAPAVPTPAEEETAPPPPLASRPAGEFALPGLPSRPVPAEEEEEEEEQQEPPVPSRNYEEREPSPVRIAVPVARSAVPDLEPPAEALPPRPVPVPEEIPHEEDLPVEKDAYDPRAAAATVAAVASEAPRPGSAAPQTNTAGGLRAVVLFDYEKAEDNELELRENEIITNINKVDPDWWMGTDSQGQSGLFPCNYVEIMEEDVAAAVPPAPAPAPSHLPASGPEPEPTARAGPTATAQFDYEAAEDNELSFPEGATVTNLEFPDEDWWFGHYKGASGLFPANYVELDQKP